MIGGFEPALHNSERVTCNSSMGWVSYLDVQIRYFWFQPEVVPRAAVSSPHFLPRQRGGRLKGLSIPKRRPHG